MIKEIKTVKDVEEFFEHLYEKESLSFHPDDDFEGYINGKTGEPSYTKEEAHERDTLMESCFVVCDQNNVDIYGVGIDVADKLNNKQK